MRGLKNSDSKEFVTNLQLIWIAKKFNQAELIYSVGDFKYGTPKYELTVSYILAFFFSFLPMTLIASMRVVSFAYSEQKKKFLLIELKINAFFLV